LRLCSWGLWPSPSREQLNLKPLNPALAVRSLI
jgi:hypothetical protein